MINHPAIGVLARWKPAAASSPHRRSATNEQLPRYTRTCSNLVDEKYTRSLFLNLKGFLYHPLPNYICKRHLSGLLWTTMFHDVSSSRNDDWSSKLGEIQLENQCQLMSTRIYHLPLSGIKHPKCVWLVVSTPIKQYARQWGGSTSYLLDGK